MLLTSIYLLPASREARYFVYHLPRGIGLCYVLKGKDGIVVGGLIRILRRSCGGSVLVSSRL